MEVREFAQHLIDTRDDGIYVRRAGGATVAFMHNMFDQTLAEYIAEYDMQFEKARQRLKVNPKDPAGLDARHRYGRLLAKIFMRHSPRHLAISEDENEE